ncbi:MAG: hypothetical protein KDM63_00425 [Verrucomicrobiae bacterium]|nr:hypothetical protein [Verrucomicrobiae bacterium]MCB1085481.1 hypothetical protein [Verrucomicrobiae bacterium]MCB1089925.1 hypothetical protein [Verrucomicrobiae bacterium]
MKKRSHFGLSACLLVAALLPDVGWSQESLPFPPTPPASTAGLTHFARNGELTYEYSLFQIQRNQIKPEEKLKPGKLELEVETSSATPKPGGPAEVVIKANGQKIAEGTVQVTTPAGFITFDCLRPRISCRERILRRRTVSIQLDDSSGRSRLYQVNPLDP